MKTVSHVWSAILSSLAILCLGSALFSPMIFSASRSRIIVPDVAIVDSESARRLTVLEEISAEHRLSVLETTVEEVRWELRAMLAGLGGLLVEAVIRLSRKEHHD